MGGHCVAETVVVVRKRHAEESQGNEKEKENKKKNRKKNGV